VGNTWGENEVKLNEIKKTRKRSEINGRKKACVTETKPWREFGGTTGGLGRTLTIPKKIKKKKKKLEQIKKKKTGGGHRMSNGGEEYRDGLLISEGKAFFLSGQITTGCMQPSSEV